LLLLSTFVHGAAVVFTPDTRLALKTAVDACLSETADGSCPDFAAKDYNGVIGAWDVSKVTDMNRMFLGKTDFNGDISKWQTGAVTNMEYMFNGATKFNGVLSGPSWDVSKVITFNNMFYGAWAFSGDLSEWNVKAAKNMGQMFAMTRNFNSDLSKWDSKWDVKPYMGIIFEGWDSAPTYEVSGFKRTVCGWGDEPKLSEEDYVGNPGWYGGRRGCCPKGKYMANPEVDPFSEAASCSECPTGGIPPTEENDDTSCYTPTPKETTEEKLERVEEIITEALKKAFALLDTC